jgi:putative transcriptional regulator
MLDISAARRNERGLSQAELTKAMDVSRQTINAIETERYTPSLPLALALARYFATTVEEIFHDTAAQVEVVPAALQPRPRGHLPRRVLDPGDLDQGLVSLALLGGFGLVFLVGGRSELIRGLRGDGRNGSPYAQLGAIEGIAYIAAVGLPRWRG